MEESLRFAGLSSSNLAMLITERDNALWHKLNGLSRFLLAHSASKLFPIYIVNEYPKSGGTWLSQMIGAALNLPYPRNRLPVMSSSVIHGHFYWPWNLHNVVMLWRDGRDVVVSLYYHYLFLNVDGRSVNNARLVRRVREDLGFTDNGNISANLPDFIDYVFSKNSPQAATWVDFVDRWADRPVVHARYEDLHADCSSELSRIVFALTGVEVEPLVASEIADRFSFARQAGRQEGEEDLGSFLRKGIVGDWRNYFGAEAKRRFERVAGRALIKLGYEESARWAGL